MTKKKAERKRGNGLRATGHSTRSKPAERDLRGLEEEWRSLVENIPDIVMTVDADGTILFINRTLPGLTVEKAIGTSVYDYTPREQRDALRKRLGRVFDSGQGHTFEMAGPGPFGRASWYFSRIGPIVRDGTVVAAVLITTDITEQRRAEHALWESEEKYRSLVQNSIDGIVIADGTEIRFVNSALLNLCGCQSEEEMVGRPFTDFVSPEYRDALVERNRAREQGQSAPTHYEFKALRKDGSTFDAEASIGRVSYQGRAATQAIVRDITDRKLAEEALSREAVLNSSIAAVSKALIQSRSTDDIAQLVLECAKDITGSPFGFVGYIDPQTGYLVAPTLTKDIWNACDVPDKNIVFKEFSGLWGWVLLKRKPLLTNAPAADPRSSGTPLGHLSINRFLSAPALLGTRLVGQVSVANSERDYTERDLGLIERLAVLYALALERKEAEGALRESEERYRDLVEDINDVIYELDGDERVTYISPVVEEISGYSPSEIVGRPFADFLHPDDRLAVMERYREGLAGKSKPIEYRLLLKSGEIRWFRSFGRPIFQGDRVVGFRGVQTDITDRKRAEEALRESEERYRILVEAAPDVIYVLSKDGVITSLNSAFESITGWSRDEWLGKRFAAIIHPEDLPAAIDDFRLVMRGEVPPVGEYRMLSKSGQYLTIETMPRPLFADGEVIGTFGIARDITQRRRAEEALRESEERYRDLVELSPDAMVVHSDEKIVFVNSEGVRLFGAPSPDQIIGRPIWDFVHPCDLKAVRKRIQGTWPKRKKVVLVEEKLVRLDGQVTDVEMAAIPIIYQGKAARQVVLRDITERIRMEEALQSAREELESAVERQIRQETAYGLTFRELTVLHLMADGRSDREIGTVLGISTLTAQKHVENIRAKMKAASRTEASVRALREGLLR